jgi:hypothetical protein
LNHNGDHNPLYNRNYVNKGRENISKTFYDFVCKSGLQKNYVHLLKDSLCTIFSGIIENEVNHKHFINTKHWEYCIELKTIHTPQEDLNLTVEALFLVTSHVPTCIIHLHPIQPDKTNPSVIQIYPKIKAYFMAILHNLMRKLLTSTISLQI